MAKEIIAHIKLQIPAGQANPAPPVGTALGPRGVNIMAFCKEFNAATQKQAGDILPVVITVFKDKSFTFITKSPPAAVLLKKAANIAAGSKEPNKTKVGKVTRKQVMEIVKTKAKELAQRRSRLPRHRRHRPSDGPRDRRLIRPRNTRFSRIGEQMRPRVSRLLLPLPAQTRRRRPVGHLHFLQNILDVLAHGGAADPESGGDLFIGCSSPEDREDFIFPACQMPFAIG